MSRPITIEVSDEVARQALKVATDTSRRVEDVLADWLQTVVDEMPIESLSNDEVLALAELTLPERDEKLLSELLQSNAEGSLNAEQKDRLAELMRDYENGLLRKSQALRVAVQRGLREPLSQ